jgi:hypothetical protein
MAMLAGEAVWCRLQMLRFPAKGIAGIFLVGLILAGSNHFIQPRMTPHEVDTSAYANVMDWIHRTYPNQPILIPWPWSDYHYLRLAYPEQPVYLANTSVFFTPWSPARDASQWAEELQRWYGDRYIGNMTSLERLCGPLLFLCWERSDGVNSYHWSWIWDDPKLRRTMIYRHERYCVYRIEGNE